MKAPEKIYITPNIDRKWQSEAIDHESIEYTRTDAFIEKAVAWLDETLRNSDFYESDIELIIKDFKNTMSNENTK